MICSSRRRILRLSFCRGYSTSNSPYASFRKLRAIPFAFDQERALRVVAPLAAVMCKNSIVSSVLSLVFPNLGSQPLQPKQMVPVYFPAWIVDAEVEAKVRYRNSQTSAIAQFATAYLPGSDYPVLSSIPLLSKRSHLVQPVPFSSHLLQQHGREVSCLPFSIYPLSGLQALRASTFDTFPGLECSLKKVNPLFAAFQPVLLPLYLAHFDVVGPQEGEHRACTIFIDASHPAGSIYITKTPTGYSDEWDQAIEDFKHYTAFPTPNPDVIVFGESNRYVDINNVSLTPPTDISRSFEHWFASQLSDPEVIRRMASLSVPGPDDDPRIRELDKEDDATFKWMALGSEIMMIQRIIDNINERVEDSQSETPPIGLEATIEDLTKKKDELRTVRESILPEWWKVYATSTKTK